MKLGIVGLPNVGKTVLFNALTRGHAGTAAYTAAEANRGMIDVPDERLERLHAVLQTPKVVHATIEVVDIPGMGGDPAADAAGGGLGRRFLADIRGVDAIAHVLRAFTNPEVAHLREGLEPLADVDLVETELVLADLELVENRMQKTAKAAKAGEKAAQHEMATLERFAGTLREGGLARSVKRSGEDQPLVRELGLLTERRVVFVLNTDDETEPEAALHHYDDLVAFVRARGDEVVAVPCRLEAELGELDDVEAAEFRRELGVPAGSLAAFIAAAYRVLGYITFFTGDLKSSESRAWQLVEGSSAREAAGRIHTDLAARFVRAEVVPVEELISCGSFHVAREHGTLRVEGKDYVVQDGDVLHIKHTA